jgi:hypothetical protein
VSRDVVSLVTLGVCVGARVVLTAIEPVLASLLAWSGAVDAVVGVMAHDEEGGASWLR